MFSEADRIQGVMNRYLQAEGEASCGAAGRPYLPMSCAIRFRATR